jgi:hypothetical protein
MVNVFFTIALYVMFAAVTGMILCVLGLIIELSLGNKEWYNKLLSGNLKS